MFKRTKENTTKSLKKKTIGQIAMLLFTGLVLVFSMTTFSWFASNKQVEANGIAISISNMDDSVSISDVQIGGTSTTADPLLFYPSQAISILITTTRELSSFKMTIEKKVPAPDDYFLSNEQYLFGRYEKWMNGAWWEYDLSDSIGSDVSISDRANFLSLFREKNNMIDFMTVNFSFPTADGNSIEYEAVKETSTDNNKYIFSPKDIEADFSIPASKTIIINFVVGDIKEVDLYPTLTLPDDDLTLPVNDAITAGEYRALNYNCFLGDLYEFGFVVE